MFSAHCITIPQSLEFVARDAFGCRERLQSVTIPDSVTTIKAEAFDSAPNFER